MKRLFVLLAACTSSPADPGTSPWPEKPAPDPLPPDPRLGTVIHDQESFSTDASVDAVFLNQHLYVAISTYDGAPRVLQIDNVSGPLEIRELPAPSAIGYVSFGITLADEGCVLVGNGARFWDGATWTDIPGGYGSLFNPLVARSASQVVIASNTQQSTGGVVARYWNGTAWTDINAPADARQTAIGPWDDTGLRVITRYFDKLCTHVQDLATNTAGAEVCTSNFSTITRDALNGTVDDFTIATDSTFRHFGGGTWTAGDNTMDWYMVHSPRTPTTYAFGPLYFGAPRDYRELDDAVLGASLIAPYDPTLTCSCDRAVDPECPCFSTNEMYTDVEVSLERREVALITNRVVDGRQIISVRGFALPLLSSPWLPAWP